MLNFPHQFNFLSGRLCCYCQPVVMYCIDVLIRTRIFTCRVNDKSVLLFNDYENTEALGNKDTQEQIQPERGKSSSIRKKRK